MPAHTPKYAVGDAVTVSHGTKDAVIVRLVKKGRKPETTLYQVEYSIDDELERTNPTTGQPKRYQQPWTENNIKPR